MLLSIVIPVYNPAHLEHKIEQFLVPQLESFKRNTSMAGLELVYVCNGCTCKTLDVLRDYQKRMPIRIVEFEQGLGFTRATNEGIKVSKGDIILLLNDDAIILDFLDSLGGRKDGWRNWLIKPFFTNPRVGITGVHELWCSHCQSNFLIGYCMACRRTMFEELGLLDEVFSPGAGEDADLCLRAKIRGWEVVNVDTVAYNMMHNNATLHEHEFTFPIYHPGESTFHNWEHTNDYHPGSKWDLIFDRNSRLLAERKARGYYDAIQPIPSTVPLLPPLTRDIRSLFNVTA